MDGGELQSEPVAGYNRMCSMKCTKLDIKPGKRRIYCSCSWSSRSYIYIYIYPLAGSSVVNVFFPSIRYVSKPFSEAMSANIHVGNSRIESRHAF